MKPPPCLFENPLLNLEILEHSDLKELTDFRGGLEVGKD
jgi:hypothetical protein